ncbi:hypothetical protein ACOI1H_24480 [Loktanella sp. DJP18]|uniref:hypothetical protein n=1 Tax=Loktanella sp. DJP18 TaxID=3409788 RepID=UPI003BB4DF6D
MNSQAPVNTKSADDIREEGLLRAALASTLTYMEAETGFEAPKKYEGDIRTGTTPFHAVVNLELKLDIKQEDKAQHSDRSLHTSDARNQINEELLRRQDLDWVKQAIGQPTNHDDVFAPIVKHCCETCDTCKGCGSVTCHGCNGRKRLPCGVSNCASGQVPCTRCSNGQQQCFTCHGNRQVSQPATYRVNPTNGGYELVTPARMVNCSTCGGYGYYGTCHSCWGTKRVTCNNCAGSAYVTCNTCRGNGTCTCQQCRSGTRYITLTGTATVTRKTIRTSSDQKQFDLLIKTIPAMLENKSATRAANLQTTQSGRSGRVEYDAKIHGALIVENYTILAGSGAHNIASFVSPKVLKEATDPVATALLDRDFARLSKTPLGRSVLEEIRQPSKDGKKHGPLERYDVDDALQREIGVFRKEFASQANRGARTSRFLLYVAACLLPLVAYEEHALQTFINAGLTDWRAPLAATVIPVLVGVMAYVTIFSRKRSKLLKGLGIGKVSLPSLKKVQAAILASVLVIGGHIAYMAAPMGKVTIALNDTGLPVDFATICGENLPLPTAVTCGSQTLLSVVTAAPSENIPIAELLRD